MMQYLLFLAITILGVSYATTTSPPDNNQPHSCNSCCQGAAGLPGIPGTGHNGLPGRDGLRGEKGETGQKGDVGIGNPGPAGPSGLSGEKGERGPRGLQGLPGKIGPRGFNGSAGIDARGLPGGKGQKGEVGQKGESGERMGRSAFTAVKKMSQSGNGGDVLTFDDTITNIGNHFSVDTNKFTCQVPGIYWFQVTMCRFNNGDPYVYLVKDNINIVIARFYDSPNHNVGTQATHGAVLQLAVGEQVWVKFGSNGEQVHSNNARYTSFSGFLLFET